MSNELTIIRKDNIDLIVSNAPAAYSENTTSHDRCLVAGKSLLQSMKEGMSDELDQQAAIFIEKARKTVRKMNDRRSSITKLFDDIRSTFTGLENDIDPARVGTIPYLIQVERNNYAAKKREEELKRQAEELRKQQHERDCITFNSSCEAFYRNTFSDYTKGHVDKLRNILANVTLDNYEQSMCEISIYDVVYPGDFHPVDYHATFSTTLSDDEKERLCKTVLATLLPTLKAEYEQRLLEEKQRILQLMPSKRQELERAAKASAEEAELIQQQIKAREEAEAARLESERQAHEQQQRAEAVMKNKQANLENLFDQAAIAKPVYQVKTSVSKKLVPLNIDAFPEIISMWWTHEGYTLSVEELSKIFKKQITFCEKLAKDGNLIKSEHIYYRDEVKAK